MSKQEKEDKNKEESAHEKFKLRKKLGELILCFKIAAILSFLGIAATFTIEHTLSQYSYFAVGLEISAGLLIGVLSFKMHTYRPREIPECPIQIANTREEAKFLWPNLSNDINQYEQAASYYFNGVRTYKYSTILLAGISTVVLGLDFGKDTSMEFAVFAKNTALVIAAVIAVLTSLFTFWNIEK